MATLLQVAAADIAAMYDTAAGHAETVTGPSGSIKAVWTADYYRPDLGDGPPIDASQPLMRTQAADALAVGDQVTRNAVTYKVASVQADGFGEVVHVMRKV
ncbi:MAG: hypothetical protein D6744_02850 [Planctomycetota bacterium]|nr:MAG: hypothetical protein D6744_02850 [Planctomycetota bacterium]